MALTILYRGTNNSIPVASASCFTQVNYGANANGNSTLSVNTPIGVLGGSVAAVSGGSNYTAFPANGSLTPIGLFVNNAAGNAFENSPAVASGKVAVIKGKASVEVDVFETNGTGNQNLFTDGTYGYAVGKSLYASAQGLLTTQQVGSNPVIGVCTSAPTLANPILGLELSL